MYDVKWSESEKKLSRTVYEAALDAELAEIMAEFKARASAVTSTEELWAMEEFLVTHRREVDQKYDYRYSQLILVFARLVREGRVSQEQLQGLSEDKLSSIHRMAAWPHRET